MRFFRVGFDVFDCVASVIREVCCMSVVLLEDWLFLSAFRLWELGEVVERMVRVLIRVGTVGVKLLVSFGLVGSVLVSSCMCWVGVSCVQPRVPNFPHEVVRCT